MKYIMLVMLTMLSGCSMIQNAVDPTGNKTTSMYFAGPGQKCAEHFIELEASVVYSGVSPVSGLVTTCVRADDSNASCPTDNVWCIINDANFIKGKDEPAK